ncbi:MAG: hypothetical protein AAFU03_04675, partial [Bacteroidota bacterium]
SEVGATQTTTSAISPFSGQLPEYWYQGKAEISTYELKQARYGELHPGVVTLIQVSEDFLTDKQVKNDRYRNPNSAPIIKTNQVRRFTTGIYDYSVMTSVFTPTDVTKLPQTQKVTMSAQDWCGQSFAQLNFLSGAAWKHQQRSYFEAEGDEETEVNPDWLEDELFNRLRMGPDKMPTGKQQILPPLSYLRLVHKPAAAISATTELTDYTGDEFSGTDLKVYRINYPSLDRTVEVFVEGVSPYLIQGWKETHPSFGKKLTTTAKLQKRILAPYWQQNKPDFATRRAEIGLGGFTK